MPGVQPMRAVSTSVSIRARPRGRAMPRSEQVILVEGEVSIRARPRGRAMHTSPFALCVVVGFQSAPGLEAGRCLVG